MTTLRRKLLLCTASLFIGLFLAEISLRIFVDQETKRLAMYDSDLGWRGRPYGTGLYVRHRDKICVEFAYNNYGFRDEDIVPRKNSAARIALLGDSFVEGLEVNQDCAFHELFESQLQEQVHPSCQVIAIASQGYSTSQQLLAFRKFQQTIDADIVLTVFYSGNDFHDNTRRRFAYLDHEGKLVFSSNPDGWMKQQVLSLKRWVYESSHVVFLLKNSIQSLTAVRFAPPSKQATDDDEDYQRDITEALLLATRREVEANGAQYGVVAIPSRDELHAGDLSRLAIVTQMCCAAGIPCLDLSEVLRNEHFFEGDPHFNHGGHRITGKEIMRFVMAEFHEQLKTDASIR